MRPLATFHPAPPYDFLKTVRASAYYTTLGSVRGSAYIRALRTPQGLALIQLTSRGSVDAPAIDLHLLAASVPVDEVALRVTVGRMLNLTLDVRGFYAAAKDDAALWSVVEPLYGLHILQTETLFEALAITMIEQQISLAAAQKAERWLVDWAGEQIIYEGERYAVFPSAARLAQVTIDDLIPLKITFRRMQMLIDVAQLEQERSLERLRALPPGDAYRALVGLKGVGHWTAAWTLIRGLGQFLYVGSADVALQAAVNHYAYKAKGRLSASATDAYFARLGPRAGLAAFYILMKWAFDRYPRADVL